MSISSKNSRHLDIGCGRIPRNPFECDELHGVDVMDIQLAGCSYKQVNVVTEKLPYTDSYFDSVSAYDFLGIIPRSAISNNTMRFPFIELMNEIYRVLKPGGIFYAVSPYYPRNEAFVDPTYVNFIAKRTHRYFTLPNLTASVYGFNGKFSTIQVRPVKASMVGKKEHSPWIVRFMKNVIYTVLYTKRSHIIWKFKAIKDQKG